MLGSLLIQPQILARMQGRSEAAELGDEALALLHRIALDPAVLATLAPAFEGAGQALGQRLADRVQTRLPQGLAALQGLLAPLLQRLNALGAAPAGGTLTVPELLGRVAEALDALADGADALSDDAIRAFVRRLARIAQQDFGLSVVVLATELRAFVADLRERLEADPDDALDAGPAATRHALACLLGRLERTLLGGLPLPDLNVDRLANLLIAELRRSGLADVRDRAACLLGKVSALLRALADVARTLAATLPRAAPAAPPVPRTASRSAARSTGRASRGVPASGSSVPPRSDDGQYCWYASWLYATRRQGFGTDTPGGLAFLQTITPGYPEDEVWLSSDRQCLVLRRAAGTDEVLHRADAPFDWHQAPQFSGSVPVSPQGRTDVAEHFVFPRIGAPFLEDWARATAVLADVAAGMWHAVLMGSQTREVSSNLPLWLWKWAQAVVAGTGAPLPSLIAQKAGWDLGGKYLFSPLVSMLGVIAASFDGVHTKVNASNFCRLWLTLLGGDALSAFTVHTVTQAVRNLTLSAFTLINYDGPGSPPSGADTRPRNWDSAGPVIGGVNTLVGMLFFKLIRREDHGLPIGGNATPFLLWMFVGAPVAGFVGGFGGALVGWAVARTATPDQLWKEPLKAGGIGLLTFLVQLYVNMEGDTDDGRYNPNVDPDGNTYAPARLPFAGYPPAATSPYRLPYAAGTALFVGQAHQGFFSHMRYNWRPQVYAYDFAHDFEDEILCCRDGVVVDYFDWIENDIDPDFSQMMAAIRAAIGWTAVADPKRSDINAAATAGAPCLVVTGQTGQASLKVDPADGDTVIDTFFNWNFILIRHTGTPDAAHDRDAGGGVVTTFAQYGHGATGSVRAAFAARGITDPRTIIGQPVQRGQVIMKAGDVGTSFHNHLHLHVMAPANATAATQAPPVTDGALSRYTLPFVFPEARHLTGRDGPLRHLTWYRSENPRLG